MAGTGTNSGSVTGAGGAFSASGSMANSTVEQSCRREPINPSLPAGGQFWVGSSYRHLLGASLVVGTCTLDGATVIGTLDVGNSVSGAQLTATNGLSVGNGTALVGNPDQQLEWRNQFCGEPDFGRERDGGVRECLLLGYKAPVGGEWGDDADALGWASPLRARTVRSATALGKVGRRTGLSSIRE